MKARGNDLSIQVQGLDALPTLIAEVSFLSGGAGASSIVSDHEWMLPSSRLATTIGSYNYAGEHWGLPSKMASPAGLPSVEATHQTIAGIVLMLLVARGGFPEAGSGPVGCWPKGTVGDGASSRHRCHIAFARASRHRDTTVTAYTISGFGRLAGES